MRKRRVTLGRGIAVIGFFLFALLFVAAINGAANLALSSTGRLAMWAVCVLSLFLTGAALSLRVGVNPFERNILASFLVFIVANIVSAIVNGITLESVERIIQIVVISSLYINITLIVRDTDVLKYVNLFLYPLYTYILLNILYWLIFSSRGAYHGIFSNPNVMAMSVMCLAPIIMIFHKSQIRMTYFIKYLFICIVYILVYSTKSRASFLAINIFLITYYIFPTISKSNLRSNITFWALIIVPSGIILLLIGGSALGYTSDIQYISSTLFGKQTILNQRGVIWASMLNEVKDSLFVGLGPHVMPSIYLDTSLSSHNLYIQVLLQVGLVGILSMVYILWQIWHYLCHRCNSDTPRISASFLAGLLFHQMFEVTLFQNNIPIAMGMWLPVFIGLGVCSRYGVYK